MFCFVCLEEKKKRKEETTDLILSSDIPHGKVDVLVLDGLDVESNGGDGGDDFSELEFVEDGGLSGGIKSDHEDAHLLLSNESLKGLSKQSSHCV